MTQIRYVTLPGETLRPGERNATPQEQFEINENLRAFFCDIRSRGHALIVAGAVIGGTAGSILGGPAGLIPGAIAGGFIMTVVVIAIQSIYKAIRGTP